jgi:hypothetical protein
VLRSIMSIPSEGLGTGMTARELRDCVHPDTRQKALSLRAISMAEAHCPPTERTATAPVQIPASISRLSNSVRSHCSPSPDVQPTGGRGPWDSNRIRPATTAGDDRSNGPLIGVSQ